MIMRKNEIGEGIENVIINCFWSLSREVIPLFSLPHLGSLALLEKFAIPGGGRLKRIAPFQAHCFWKWHSFTAIVLLWS